MLVVFTGPSLEPAAVRAALPHADVRPPACRGDVAAAAAEGASTILLIDGGFAHRLAVAPSELIAALRAGVRVIGAASLGAIRAAECGPAGMEGAGAVTALYRFGVLRDDDEVAVAVEPDRDYRASSIALVSVRFAVLGALRTGRLDRSGAERVLAAARAMHFSERQWRPILAVAGLDGDAELLALCRGVDVKRRDARLAVARVAELPVAGPRVARPRVAGPRVAGPRVARPRVAGGWTRPPDASDRTRPPDAPVVRYRGHDPCFGESEAALSAELRRWLAGSGRARRLWPGAPPPDGDVAWRHLAGRQELAIELMRLHAVRRGAGLVSSADGPPLGPYLDRARAQIATAHGFPGWAELETAGGPPDVALAWIRAAAHRLALARRNLGA